MTLNARVAYKFKYTTEDIVKDSKLWVDDSIQRMAELWRNYPELMNAVGYLQ